MKWYLFTEMHDLWIEIWVCRSLRTGVPMHAAREPKFPELFDGVKPARW